MWEFYVIGYVQDYGAFVFCLNDGEFFELVFLVVEYQDEIEVYYQAFFLFFDWGMQVFMLFYDWCDCLFCINLVFECFIVLQLQDGLIVQENWFLFLWEDSIKECVIVIDLKNWEQVELFFDIQWKSDEDVFDWMKVMQQLFVLFLDGEMFVVFVWCVLVNFVF